MPRIYVASLSDYNSGILHGRWIDAAQDESAIETEIQAMLNASKDPSAEECAIHDHEGFMGFPISEYESIETVAALAQSLDEHGEPFAIYARNVGFEEAVKHLEEAYQGEHKSMEDFAYQLLDDCGTLQEMPETLRNYFDFEKYGRDLELGGDYSFDSGHVFNNHV